MWAARPSRSGAGPRSARPLRVRAARRVAARIRRRREQAAYAEMLPTERKSACLGLYRLGFFDGIGAAVERALKVNGLDTGAAGSTVCWRPREPGVYSPGPPTTPAGTGRSNAAIGVVHTAHAGAVARVAHRRR